MLTRRSIIFGLIAAPVVVRMGLIMPVRAIELNNDWSDFMRKFQEAYDKMALHWQWGYAAYDSYENDGWGINWPFVSGERT